MVGGANHHQSVESIVFERQIVNVASLSFDFVAVELFGLGEFGLGIIENGGGFGAGKVFVGEAAVATGNIDKFIHIFGQKSTDGEAVGGVFVFAVSIFPEDFFIIVAVVIGDDVG